MRGWREQTASIFYRARCAVEKLTLNLLTTTIVAPPSNSWQHVSVPVNHLQAISWYTDMVHWVSAHIMGSHIVYRPF